MSGEQVMIGLGLIAVLAVGSQVLAARLRIPALIVLLPVGFAAGALTDDVHPDRLLGHAYSPLVSLAVAVILYDAGLGLDRRRLTGRTRRTTRRLVGIGALLTPAIAAVVAAPLLGLSADAAVMLGTVLIVSGPTVVGPLLDFVRPTARLRRILEWEGSLIDAVGGILGALVFHALVADERHTFGASVLEFLGSAGLGLLGGAVGVALLWLLLRRLELSEMLGTTAQLAVVLGVAAGCDAVREDSGLVAAIAMGVALASTPGFDVQARKPFFETLVSLVVGLLFIAISATVTPASLHHVVLPALAVAAVLIVLARPLVAWLATLGGEAGRGERAFLGWMAPRGIVAASTASTFGTELAARGVGGAGRILPATFVVITATVTVYGLTAVPVARRLGVVRPARSRPLLVGGSPWVVELALTLRRLGLDVLLWAGGEEQRRRIRQAGLVLAEGELLAAATGAGAELEGVTDVLLLTEEYDFNALAATLLRTDRGPEVHRLAPPAGDQGVVAPFFGGSAVFGPGLDGRTLAERCADGARISVCTTEGPLPPGHDLLFALDREGRLRPATAAGPPELPSGGTAVLLGPAEGTAADGHPALPISAI